MQTESEQLFEESKKYIPGGVNSPVRAFGSVGRSPIFIKKAKGSRIFDEDGREYIDYVCSWGPGILGHTKETVIEAVKAACDDGLTFGAPTRKELEIAELITAHMPSMEMSRMVNSGTEAVMSAIRAARGFTGRDYIVKFKGCYHGHSDGLLVKAGSGVITQTVANSAGVPEGYAKYTLVADYVCSWGPGILGHTKETVIEAVKAACDDGLTFGAPTRKELEIAELITAHMPSMEMSRMVNSGTEAVMSAIRAARGFTGRDYIVKFKGCYHGHSDGLLVKAGSGVITQTVANSAGVPEGYAKYTLVAEYNDEESVKQLFDAHKGQIAAIIVEPVAANMGVVPPKAGFLEFLRDITQTDGALLIFDEVITGFRLAPGGAQEYFHIKPDLTTLGKIVGGGMPVGTYGGRREIMQCVAPLGEVYQAGTLSGNPIAMTAGIETLKLLDTHPEVYAKLEGKTAGLAQAARETFGDQVCVNQIGSLMSIFFTDKQVVDMDTAMTSDTKQYAAFFRYMLDHGINLAPSQFEAMFISDAHTEEDIRKTIDVMKEFAHR